MPSAEKIASRRMGGQEFGKVHWSVAWWQHWHWVFLKVVKSMHLLLDMLLGKADHAELHQSAMAILQIAVENLMPGPSNLGCLLLLLSPHPLLPIPVCLGIIPQTLPVACKKPPESGLNHSHD